MPKRISQPSTVPQAPWRLFEANGQPLEGAGLFIFLDSPSPCLNAAEGIGVSTNKTPITSTWRNRGFLRQVSGAGRESCDPCWRESCDLTSIQTEVHYTSTPNSSFRTVLAILHSNWGVLEPYELFLFFLPAAFRPFVRRGFFSPRPTRGQSPRAARLRRRASGVARREEGKGKPLAIETKPVEYSPGQRVGDEFSGFFAQGRLGT